MPPQIRWRQEHNSGEQFDHLPSIEKEHASRFQIEGPFANVAKLVASAATATLPDLSLLSLQEERLPTRLPPTADGRLRLIFKL